MLRVICYTIVVDNCQLEPEELEKKIKSLLLAKYRNIEVLESSYPGQRVIRVYSRAHIEEVMKIIEIMNEEEKR